MTLRVDVSKGLRTADAVACVEFADRRSSDLTPFWRAVGQTPWLDRKRNRRWPFKRRRSGRLRRVFDLGRDSKLGRGGVFESSPDRLLFGTNVFYSAIIHQHGAKRLPGAPADSR